ncbi:hypothetical protein IMW82_02770 [Rhodanobacter sp. B2A1Ga4]|uniref:hypothetical protein n=1 Tax=Rhodanobacter sp. B2A1Ga4 TaxID=2778647 RepID=UPI001B35A197|nr:hypothetical protein [Rhodanobacter sp. B2A1Ga4]MBQ4853600.1 hypothetical protein [Rhodanobacter sp. B2A1Ga4]
MADPRIRAALLDVLEQNRPRPGSEGNLQSNQVLSETAKALGIRRDHQAEQALLTEWNELFRTGYLAWGHDLNNPNPPFCHFTERGVAVLEHAQRDPANPQGYLAHLARVAEISPIAMSYLTEALDCYVAGLHKAGAVLLGGAAERLAADVRDAVVHRAQRLNEKAPEALNDWRIKRVLDALKAFFDQQKQLFAGELKERYEAYWPAFTQHIRAIRNDAGHPSSIEPITADAVHAAFLVFPEVANVAGALVRWARAVED